MIREKYEARNTTNQFGNLTLNFFTDPSRPRKKPPQLTTRVKAAETTHLLPIIREVWEAKDSMGS